MMNRSVRMWALVLSLVSWGFVACDDSSSEQNDVDVLETTELDLAEVELDTQDISDDEEEEQEVEDLLPETDLAEVDDDADLDVEEIDEMIDLEDAEEVSDLSDTDDLDQSEVVEDLDAVEEFVDLSDQSDQMDTEDDGLVGEALREALRIETTQGHYPLGYDGGRDEMYAIGGIDDNDGRIECIYTGRTVEANGSRTPSGDCRYADGTSTSCSFNTEHTWARYYLRLYLTDGSAEYNAAEGDIHHLFPSDSQVNSYRWHFDFGATSCLSDNNCKVDEGSQLGLKPGVNEDPNCPTGDLTKDGYCAMLVRPERRGDIARAQFYMAVRYSMPIDDVSEAYMRQWNLEDPPDAHEMDRNDAIEVAQGNRNPFVDDYTLVDRIEDY